MDLENELARLSLETGMGKDEIKKEVDELKTGDRTEDAALAIWKSNNSFKLGGKVMQKPLLRILGAEAFRDEIVRTSKNGNKYAVFQAFVINVDDEELKLGRCMVFREEADKVKDLMAGDLYTCESAKIQDDKGGLFTDVMLTGSLVKSDKTDVPHAKELVKMYKPTPLKDITDYIGSTVLTSGLVGKIYQGTGNNMVEISDEGGNPIPVWTPLEVSEAMVGKRVFVTGYLSSGKRGLTINATTVMLE